MCTKNKQSKLLFFRPPNSQFESRESPSSNHFVWPPNYVATSTPVTSASTPVPHSPARNYHQLHHMVGLPVASTQYRSPYAVPQSSSGSSASTGFREAPPPPPPPPLQPLPPTTNNYITHALPVRV